MNRIARAIVVPLLLCAAAVGQAADFAKEEAALQKQCSQALINFARNAELSKVKNRAKQAYDLVITDYEPDNATARQALGYHRVKDNWELPKEEKERRTRWEDRANNEQRFRVVDEWHTTSVKLGALHRDLGLKMVKGEAMTRGAFHLEKAIYYNPFDKAAHLALGHKEGKGLFGTESQVAFVQRMGEVETYALLLAKKEYACTPLPQEQLPIEFKNAAELQLKDEYLKKYPLEFSGSKSEHFLVWTRGTQENADNCVKWAERALNFLGWIVGEDAAKKLSIEKRMKAIDWWGFVWTDSERDMFLKANPQIYEGKTVEVEKRFANDSWKSPTGIAMVHPKLTPAGMHDCLITWVFKLGLTTDGNDALGEGIQHAATWYLMSTCISRFGAVFEGTTTGKELELPESTSWWLRKIRDDAMSHQDFPIARVPHEQLAQFHNDCRIKSWSFMTWLWARFPDKWLMFYVKMPKDRAAIPEVVGNLAKDTFGETLEEIEAEWREWARGDSGVAAATGYGPPLLPERPNKEEIAALERMNAIRGLAVAYSVNIKEPPPSKDAKDAKEPKEKPKEKPKDPKDKLPENDLRDGGMHGLPLTDLDAEASMACEDHAKYLLKWPEQHMKWPEAHEENPALEGFTPRGMRCGMRSVIVFVRGNPGVEYARDSIDGWIGTVWHRFPLLEHNIWRFGYSYVNDVGMSVAVLDMGSLEEPYDPLKAPKFIAFPAPDMHDVPTAFDGNEEPNPLADQPPGEQDILKTGYPVSLQLQREFARTLQDSSIQLFEVKPGPAAKKSPARHLMQGKATPGQGNADETLLKSWVERRGEEVVSWVHTPAKPLMRRMENKEVVFAIPKEHLKTGTVYQAAVMLKQGPNPELMFIWEFKTGSQKRGLHLK